MKQKYQKNKRKDVYQLSLYFLLFFDLICLGISIFLAEKGTTCKEAIETANQEISSKIRDNTKNQTEKTSNQTGKKMVIPCGIPVGIYVKTEGLLVLDTQTIKAADGLSYEPAKDKVKAGDYIISVDGKKVETKEAFQEKIMDSQGKEMTLLLERAGKQKKAVVKPIMTEEGVYKVGIWLRDDTQGLGTITYIDGNKFGALGHGINDYDTGTQMNIEGGSLYEANILSIQKGKKGTPGELIGQVKYGIGQYLGKITENGEQGIYGTLSCDSEKLTTMEPVEIAEKKEVKKGNASIRIQLEGELKDYEIKILKVDYADRNKKQGILFKITDEELLELTGGVVQGMSGSPIIQDGKIVGAVTHVLVNDPTRGYGIFIENMLEAAGKRMTGALAPVILCISMVE